MWILLLIGFGIAALSHMAPAPLVLDAMAGGRVIWHMPRDDPATVYLTFDDGPNPTTTPDLLDVLAAQNAHATFFLIDRHITPDTAPIVRRMFVEGHAVALHSATRKYMLMAPSELAHQLNTAASHIEMLTGSRPCRAFRPHAGWRGGEMFNGLREIDYTLVGWGWMLWDFNWFKPRRADDTIARVARRIRGGDIVVMHDGDESAPTEDQRQTVDAASRLIPALRERGLSFGTVCHNQTPAAG